jgi:hypothetical protein
MNCCITLSLYKKTVPVLFYIEKVMHGLIPTWVHTAAGNCPPVRPDNKKEEGLQGVRASPDISSLAVVDHWVLQLLLESPARQDVHQSNICMVQHVPGVPCAHNHPSVSCWHCRR